MGWYALYKWFRSWNKTPYADRIKEHKDFLKKQWFESLSPEEQGKYLRKKKESHRNAMQALNFMLAFNAVYSDYYK